jgi:hypothetical protein
MRSKRPAAWCDANRQVPESSLRVRPKSRTSRAPRPRLVTRRSTKSHFVTLETEPLERGVLLDGLDGNAAAIGTSTSSRLVKTLASAHGVRRLPMGATCAISQTRPQVPLDSRDGDQGGFANA